MLTYYEPNSTHFVFLRLITLCLARVSSVTKPEMQGSSFIAPAHYGRPDSGCPLAKKAGRKRGDGKRVFGQLPYVMT